MSSFCLNNGFRLQKTNRAARRWKQPPKKPFHYVSRDKIIHDSSLGQGFLRPPFWTRRRPWARGWDRTWFVRHKSAKGVDRLDPNTRCKHIRGRQTRSKHQIPTRYKQNRISGVDRLDPNTWKYQRSIDSIQTPDTSGTEYQGSINSIQTPDTNRSASQIRISTQTSENPGLHGDILTVWQ